MNWRHLARIHLLTNQCFNVRCQNGCKFRYTLSQITAESPGLCRFRVVGNILDETRQHRVQLRLQISAGAIEFKLERQVAENGCEMECDNVADAVVDS